MKHVPQPWLHQHEDSEGNIAPADTDTLIRSTHFDVRELLIVGSKAYFLLENDGEFAFLGATMKRYSPQESEKERNKLIDSLVWGKTDEVYNSLQNWDGGREPARSSFWNSILNKLPMEGA